MKHPLARRLIFAAVLAVSALTTACPPPPWAFWRHEHREERRDDRYDHRDDRQDDRHERHDDRHDDRNERHDDRHDH